MLLFLILKFPKLLEQLADCVVDALALLVESPIFRTASSVLVRKLLHAVAVEHKVALKAVELLVYLVNSGLHNSLCISCLS